MIVKTGANYQAEGGYIDASVKGELYTLTNKDQSVKFGGSEEFGPLIVPVTIINQTDRTLSPTCVHQLSNLGEVLGTPTTPIIGANETATIKCVAIIGMKMRISYSGSNVELKCDSEYVTVENGGAYASYAFVKMPENGDPVTMRLYIGGGE